MIDQKTIMRLLLFREYIRFLQKTEGRQKMDKKLYNRQLRQQVRMVVALNDDYNYKMLASEIDITQAAFYNWLADYYDFGWSRARKLYNLTIDLLD